MGLTVRVALVLLGSIFIAGCSSISRQNTFSPCSDPQCGRCRGTKTYKCEECLGRGSTPCRGCKGTGLVKCFDCGGDGIKDGRKCGCALGLGPPGFKTCPVCNGTRFEQCRGCRGKGMVDCGSTTVAWVCRQCGARYDYSPEVCTKCGAK
jgi:ribosomal protein L40E